MLITDHLVFVHMPKTGGTFVDQALRQMLSPSKLSRKVHSIRSYWGIRIPGFRYHYIRESTHLGCESIPNWAREYPIIACVRNPYDWYVSDYRYGVWKQSRAWSEFWDPDCQEQIFARYPHWPNLSFEQYVKASNEFTRRILIGRNTFGSPNSVGLMTLEFLRCFAWDRPAIFRRGKKNLAEQVRAHLYPIRFIHMDNLNEELVVALLSLGYSQKLVEPILRRPRVYPGSQTRPVGDNWTQYYSNELKQTVRQLEWVLFELFPEYDF